MIGHDPRIYAAAFDITRTYRKRTTNDYRLFTLVVFCAVQERQKKIIVGKNAKIDGEIKRVWNVKNGNRKKRGRYIQVFVSSDSRTVI